MSKGNNEVRPAGISEDGGQWNRTCEYKAAPARDTKDCKTILIVMFGLWFEPAMWEGLKPGLKHGGMAI